MITITANKNKADARSAQAVATGWGALADQTNITGTAIAANDNEAADDAQQFVATAEEARFTVRRLEVKKGDQTIRGERS